MVIKQIKYSPFQALKLGVLLNLVLEKRTNLIQKYGKQILTISLNLIQLLNKDILSELLKMMN